MAVGAAVDGVEATVDVGVGESATEGSNVVLGRSTRTRRTLPSTTVTTISTSTLMANRRHSRRGPSNVIP